MRYLARTRVVLVATGVAALLCAGCDGGGEGMASPSPSVDSSADASGVTVTPGTWTEAEPGQAYLTLRPDGTISAYDRCNTLNGVWSAIGTTVTIRIDGGTEKSCEGIDTWLKNATSATVGGDELTVMDETGEVIGELSRAAG